MRTPLILIACLALAPLAAGCGSLSTDYCDRKCDCENCSEREYDECLVENDAEAEVASIYACDVEYEERTICRIEEHSCTAGVYTVDPSDLLACVSDENDHLQCLERGSRLF